MKVTMVDKQIERENKKKELVRKKEEERNVFLLKKN